jgi:hypothetical protein
LVEQIADVQQMTEEEIWEIGARWEGLCDLAAEAGISEAGRERRQKATRDFATANPCRLHAFAEYFAREYPDGPPPASGATEAERQMILEHRALIPEAAQLTLLALVAAFAFPPGGEDDPGPRLWRSSPL